MKTLYDYVAEQLEITEAAETEKTVIFNFADLENAEDTLKSFEDKEGCTVEDNKLTVKVNADNFNKLDTVQDILQQFCKTIRNSQKVASDEQYAQKTKSFEDKLNEFNKAIADFETTEKDDDKKEE